MDIEFLFVFLILSSFLVQEGVGFSLPSWDATTGYFKFKGRIMEFNVHRRSLTQNEPYEHRHLNEHLMSALKHPNKKPKDDYISPQQAIFHKYKPFNHFEVPTPAPMISPRNYRKKTLKTPSPSILALPSPPPSQDCTELKCSEPLTYSAAGSSCGCVWPIEVSLKLNVTLYTFFPHVSELSKEIAASLLLHGTQVRIMGANAPNQELQKTVVIINLVPLEEQFDGNTAFSIYRKFWKGEVYVQPLLFGTYDVIHVLYPGLPPSPPQLPSETATIESQPYHRGSGIDGTALKPLGVDVSMRKRNTIGRNMVIVIVLSSIAVVLLCLGFISLILLKCKDCTRVRQHTSDALISSEQKPLGSGGSLLLGSSPVSTPMSVGSSILAYAGTAKIFSLSNIEKATNNFDASNIIGEGGFGIVYSGILEGRNVAVKLSKGIDQQASREYLAEIEMLSRLHHRNLVKLIGICTEAHMRCLVYELVPNGSVESHLHGVEKDTSPLDWHSRLKIALGAARGLAYLHEDSNPPVIHRDFKSSNVLLEHDYTPKVADFGLARAAQEEQNKYISTHVMGTFGYLAPEYAMTGHLLVKSDVYSYGVVLLELLTGRKPVDLSQPTGQENLVAWARPQLTSKESLETIVDPSLKQYITSESDSVTKFAAIASMCVQPEVSHRPFMGEVVQALKLVCNEFDEMSRRSWSHELSIGEDSKHSSRMISGEFGEVSNQYSVMGCDSNPDNDHMTFPSSNIVRDHHQIEQLESQSFRRQFNSAPLKLGRKMRFWERLKKLSRGSMSEHGFESIMH